MIAAASRGRNECARRKINSHSPHPHRIASSPRDAHASCSRRSPLKGLSSPPWAVEYLMDEEVRWLPIVKQRGAELRALASVLEDGDAVLRAVDVEYNWRTLPPDGVPPLELWRVHRVVLARVGDDYVSETEGGSDPRLRDAGGRLVGVGQARKFGTLQVVEHAQVVATHRPRADHGHPCGRLVPSRHASSTLAPRPRWSPALGE